MSLGMQVLAMMAPFAGLAVLVLAGFAVSAWTGRRTERLQLHGIRTAALHRPPPPPCGSTIARTGGASAHHHPRQPYRPAGGTNAAAATPGGPTARTGGASAASATATSGSATARTGGGAAATATTSGDQRRAAPLGEERRAPSRRPWACPRAREGGLVEGTPVTRRRLAGDARRPSEVVEVQPRPRGHPRAVRRKEHRDSASRCPSPARLRPGSPGRTFAAPSQ